MAEAVYQRLLLARLGALGPAVWFDRINVLVARAGGRFVRSAKDGTSDVLVCVAGRFVAIEVKDDGEGQDQDQKDWQAEVEAAGGIYILAVGAAGVLAAVQRVSDLAGMVK